MAGKMYVRIYPPDGSDFTTFELEPGQAIAVRRFTDDQIVIDRCAEGDHDWQPAAYYASRPR